MKRAETERRGKISLFNRRREKREEEKERERERERGNVTKHREVTLLRECSCVCVRERIAVHALELLSKKFQKSEREKKLEIRFLQDKEGHTTGSSPAALLSAAS